MEDRTDDMDHLDVELSVLYHLGLQLLVIFVVDDSTGCFYN